MTNRQTGINACNFCGTDQTNPTTAGWVRFPGTDIDVCTVCGPKPLAEMGLLFKVPVPAAAPGAPGGMQRILMPNGSQMMQPVGAPLPAGAQILPAGIDKPAPAPVKSPAPSVPKS